MGYSRWGHKESDMTKRLSTHTLTHTHTHTLTTLHGLIQVKPICCLFHSPVREGESYFMQPFRDLGFLRVVVSLSSRV